MLWTEVRDLLQMTARRLDATAGDYDNRGHSPFFGYGQVDAFRAVTGIPALSEIERSAATESRGAGIQALISYLRGSPSGQAILAHLHARRLFLLAAMQDSAAVREAVNRTFRTISSLGLALSSGAAVAIPEQVWTDVATIAAIIRAAPTENTLQ
jgi:hypothetical protein